MSNETIIQHKLPHKRYVVYKSLAPF